jgi:hypothetical protein
MRGHDRIGQDKGERTAVTAVESGSESESRQRRYVEGDTCIEGAAPVLQEGTKPRGVRDGRDKRIERVLVQRRLSAHKSQRIEQAKLCFAWAGLGWAGKPDGVVCRGCLKTAAEFIWRLEKRDWRVPVI